MTMNIRIKNLGPASYAAEVSRGGAPHFTLQPGQSRTLYGWKDGGDIAVREVPASNEVVPVDPGAFVSSHALDANGNPAGGSTTGVGFEIDWQNGPLGRGENRTQPNGAFVEAIISAAKDRLEFYQNGADGKFACDENARAIAALDGALAALHERTAGREAREVEGTHEA